MKLHILCLLLVLFTTGCGSNFNPSATSPRSYNGTASVGDFLTITLDPAAHTLTYNNLSNLDTGTIPYSVNSDGTYSLNDPTGNLIAAYEVPNYALLVQATKTGPNHDALALVTAVDKGTISTAIWAGHGYNYMQFRTSSGGVEVGSAILDTQGNVSVTGYWPYGSIGQGAGAFNIGNFDASTFHADPSGTFLTIAENNGTSDYVFGTPNGIFAVDTPNGAILGLKKAASKNFDSSFAGTYKAIYYQKTGANTGPNNTETGTPSLGNATLAITSGGQINYQRLSRISPGRGYITDSPLPRLHISTVQESSAIPVTACSPSAWSPPDFSKTSSSHLWTERFCSHHSVPPCPGDRGTPTIICTASG